MRKRFITIVIFVLFTLSLLAGCRPNYSYTIDPNKTQIYISVYNGGHGYEWVNTVAAAFFEKNPEYDEKYEIVVIPEKRNEIEIINEMKSPYSDKQAVITSANNFQSGIYSDVFEDLSDILDMKVDGEGQPPIGEKILRYDDWHTVYSKYGEGLYALPFADSIVGYIYDHQMFDENFWYEYATESNDGAALAAQGISYTAGQGGKLIFQSATGKTTYKQGDNILSKGKDGIYGTYDDGQPVDIAGWETLIDSISATGTKAFISGGGVADYSNFILHALFAQYEGQQGWDTYFNYDSNGQPVKLLDGSEIVIDLENGYRVNEMEGVYKSYEFMYRYLNAAKGHPSEPTMHPAVTDGAKSHIDTQNLFLLGYRQSPSNPQSAMLLDGAWFEYEARNMFNALGKTDSDRGYGKREYRFMLLPDLDGQKSDKSVFASCESGAMLIGKDANKARLQVTKEFFAFILSNENLRYFTKETGSIMPYNYQLTESDWEQLTPFNRNMIDLYYDEENINIVRPRISCLLSPLGFATTRGTTIFTPKIDKVFAPAAIRTIRDFSLNEIYEGLQSVYTKTEWNRFLDVARDQGFYN